MSSCRRPVQCALTLGALVASMVSQGAVPALQAVTSSPDGRWNLRWTGGTGPYVVERTESLAPAAWDAELATSEPAASVTGHAPHAYYRVVDLGAGAALENAFLEARMGARFTNDLAALVRIPTYRDESPESETRVLANLARIQTLLGQRIEAFNAGQRTLRIQPFEWRATVNGNARWVFGFRLGTGPRKFAMLTHLDTVPPGGDGWAPFEPRIEVLPYRGSTQPFMIGRGAIDDKGPAVTALSVLEAAARWFDGTDRLRDWTLEVTFDSNEEIDLNIPDYFAAVGAPEFGIVFDAFWAVRAEKGVERPVFQLPLSPAAPDRPRVVSLLTSPGSVNQIPDQALARIDGGDAAALDSLAATLTNRYAAFAFDDPAYRRAPLSLTRDGSAIVLTTQVEGAQHGSAPAENRANGANPLVSLANFLAGLVADGTLGPSSQGNMAELIRWGWGTQVFGEKHPDLLQRLDSVFQEGNGTTYALTRVTATDTQLRLAIDIRYAIGHHSTAWDGATDGVLAGSSIFPAVFETLVQRFNSEHPGVGLTAVTVNHGAPDVRNPDGEKFRQIRAAYEAVVGTPCPLFAIGGGSDAHGATNLVAAGALFSADFDPPINYHGTLEGAPLSDLRLSAKILWQLVLRQVGDPAGGSPQPTVPQRNGGSQRPHPRSSETKAVASHRTP